MIFISNKMKRWVYAKWLPELFTTVQDIERQTPLQVHVNSTVSHYFSLEVIVPQKSDFKL